MQTFIYHCLPVTGHFWQFPCQMWPQARRLRLGSRKNLTVKLWAWALMTSHDLKILSQGFIQRCSHTYHSRQILDTVVSEKPELDVSDVWILHWLEALRKRHQPNPGPHVSVVYDLPCHLWWNQAVIWEITGLSWGGSGLRVLTVVIPSQGFTEAPPRPFLPGLHVKIDTNTLCQPERSGI